MGLISNETLQKAINKHEGGTAEIIHSETHTEKMIFKNTKNMSEQGDNFKQFNTHTTGVSEGVGEQTHI